jgi:rhodanese-related sulfurtransferase
MHKWSRALKQIPVVILITVAIAFAFNEFNPKGIDVKRQYFPPLPAATPAQGPAHSTPAAGGTQPRLRFINTEEAKKYFESADYLNRNVVFIDARDETRFDKGHIPGALLIDYYNLKGTLSTALSYLSPEKTLIVYCTGGTCQDSRYVAYVLWDYGFRKILIYEDGFDCWAHDKLPVETLSYKEMYGDE